MSKRRMMVVIGAMSFAVAGVILAFLFPTGLNGADRAARMKLVRGEFAAKKVNGANWIAPPTKSPKTGDWGVRIGNRELAKDDERLTETEEMLVDTIHDALNKEDLALAIKLAHEAVRSKKAEVRSEMVDTLSWFGETAMPELLMFIDDPDEGVKMDAAAAYQQAIYDIEDDKEKAKVIEISMRHLDDVDALGEIASELIGMDDVLAVQTLVNVIDGGGKAGRRIAKETYETITGEEYTTFEAAEAWVREEQAK